MAPGANVRLSLDYAILKNVQIGYGITKNNMSSDFNAKWNVLEQTTESMPIAVTLYGNIAIDGRKKSVFDTLYYNNSDVEDFYGYKFSNRFSYFSQLIVSRKMNDNLSLQLGVSFSHYNTVVTGMDHDRIGIHYGGRMKVSPQGAIILTGDWPLKISDLSDGPQKVMPQPNISIGYEIATSGHDFQIFAGTSNALVPQNMMMNNMSKIELNYFSVGFIITRLWSF